jgi:hypothetical protein
MELPRIAGRMPEIARNLKWFFGTMNQADLILPRAPPA